MIIGKRPLAAAALAASSVLALGGCFLTPGSFTSELQLMKDGSFSYVYDGEIQMLGLSRLAEMADKDEAESFAPYCFDDTTMAQRECEPAEAEAQRREWDAQADERARNRQREAEQVKALLGGIDPSDPDAAQELAQRLERQRGWDKVSYLGKGLFDVEFRVNGRLTPDFAFPTIERFPLASQFVSVVVRDGGQVRVDAPGFAAMGAGNPMQSLAMGAAGLSELKDGDGEMSAPATRTEGTFTLVTDGQILANNTDEGPVAGAKGAVLTWTITPRTTEAPTALVAID